jgi:tetratricopeptide (TPR) repeat protein
LLLAGSAWADRVWIGRAPPQQTTVLGVENGNLLFRTGGREYQEPMTSVTRLEIDNQDRLNAAEAAFAEGRFAEAARLYQQVIDRRGNQTWITLRSTRRLVDSADRSGDFGGAAAGFVELVRLDPAAAADNVPDPANARGGADVLTAAQGRVQRALDSRVDDNQRRALLTLLLRITMEKNDAGASAAVAARLGDLLGDEVPTDEAERGVFAQVVLARARLDLEAGDAAGATKRITNSSAAFTKPLDQVRALLVLAKAAESEAGEDRTKQLDAALAYMKVVAHARTAGESANAPAAEALLLAGDVHASLGLTDDANDLYESAATDYADTPAGVEAQQKLAVPSK